MEINMTHNNIDKSNMREVILQTPGQFIKGLDLAKDIKIDGQFKNIVICGVGGSALPGDLINSLTNPSVPVYIHRNYDLPTIANQDSLIICISYSGNTEETISALQQAIKNNYKTIGLSSGGQIEKICEENKLPFVKIPSGIQPRSATGYIFSIIAGILTNCEIIKDISEIIKQTVEQLESTNNNLEQQGMLIAKKIAGKIPLIYASDNLQSIAKIWKIKFNENSKIPAFYNYFPELNHNEMVGFTNTKMSSNFYVLMMKDNNDHQSIIKRIDLLTNILTSKGIKNEIIDIADGSQIFKTLSSLLLGDWISYYVAINSKVDPTPVDIVEEFKGMMTS